MTAHRQLKIKMSDSEIKDYNSDEIIKNLQDLSWGLSHKHLDFELVEQKLLSGFQNNMSYDEFVKYQAETLAYLNINHPDYAILASRVLVQRLHENTTPDVAKYAQNLVNFQEKGGRICSILNEETYNVFINHTQTLQSIIDYKRDYNYDVFGFKTMEKSYLLKRNGIVIERPQQLILRVSIGIHGNDLDRVKETYDLMSDKWFTHATPTLFNSGTIKSQMSSCFLLMMTEDSINGIYETLTRCAHISKNAGGIGLAISNIRASGTYINGTNGVSNGIVPMLRVYDSTARYVDQGGGRRKGSFAMYLEPWHADVFDFLELKKNHGKEEMRARDLFYALWIPDLFMKRVEMDGEWTLMCPAECPGLVDVWGDKFDQLYEKYEREGKGRKTIKARKLWQTIIQSQIETGTPYMLYKDSCNRKSNQQNLGTIKSSNLCTEILEYTDKDEVAVCNLASISLPRFVNKENKTFDFESLIRVTRVITFNLNKVIDKNYYPIEECKKSNFRHRPIGIGVQGLANVFAMLKMDYDSDQALLLNNQIFETIYYAACFESMEISKIEGPYETFAGSPASKGILQFDMWNVDAKMYPWNELKQQIVQFGMRNSLLVAPMPTASTSQILGNNETFEAFTTNIYTRRVLSGEFICVNRHLIEELLEIDLWNQQIKNEVMAHNGSIQNIKEIPDQIKRRFRTVWELPQKKVIDLATGRSPFIDQSQSLNIFLPQPDYSKVTSMHFYGWKSGLKTDQPLMQQSLLLIVKLLNKFKQIKEILLIRKMLYYQTKLSRRKQRFVFQDLKDCEMTKIVRHVEVNKQFNYYSFLTIILGYFLIFYFILIQFY